MTTIAANLQHVRQRIASACASAQRDVNEVTLLPVSKTFGPEAVREAWAAGETAFGENYIQEAVEKIALLRDLPLQWHCIGRSEVAGVHSVGAAFSPVRTFDGGPEWNSGALRKPR